MTARTAGACARVYDLSAYLDGELAAPEERAVEAHLARCRRCRTELEGLRRVVERVQSLQRATPPPALAETVARRVALETGRRGLLDRLEGALRRLPVEPATLLTFGVVVALAAIVSLFVAGLQESDRRPATRAEPGQDYSGLEVVTVVVEGRTFDRDGALWRQRGAGEPERRLEADSPEAESLFDSEPRLRRLLQGSEGIVLRGPDGTTLRIDP
ncbi:MAG: anti-sigma factor family protein [Thermoanaerobaculia bacterium]